MRNLEDLENYIEPHPIKRGEIGPTINILAGSKANHSERESAYHSLFMHYVDMVHKVVQRDSPDSYDEDMLQDCYAALAKELRGDFQSLTKLSPRIYRKVGRTTIRSFQDRETIRFPNTHFEKIKSLEKAVERAVHEDQDLNPHTDTVYNVLKEISPKETERYDKVKPRLTISYKSSEPEFGRTPLSSFWRDSRFWRDDHMELSVTWRSDVQYIIEKGFWNGDYSPNPNADMIGVPQTISGEYQDPYIGHALSIPPTVDSDVIRKEETDMLVLAMQTLSRVELVTLKGRYANDKTLQQIANAMGVSREAVRCREEGAMRKVRRFITKSQKWFDHVDHYYFY